MADTVVGDLVARLRADTSDFTSGLGTAEKQTKSFASKIEDTGRTLTSVGTKMTAGITLPIVAIGAASIKMASDLEESQNKVRVVFGKSADAIEDWSEDAAESMLMSSQQALEAAGTFGNLFRSMEIATPAAAKMSMKLVQLAADLASFNNASPEEALLALRSGLVGEIEPLRRFGVSLSAARVEAKAFEMGLATQGETLSAAAKAQAAYQIILEDTALAQGDVARTQDSAANQARIFQAQLRDLGAEIGQTLLPPFQKMLSIAQSAIRIFDGLPGPVKEMLVAFGAFAAAAGPALMITGSIMRNWQTMSTTAPKTAKAVGMVGLAVGAFVETYSLTTKALDAITTAGDDPIGDALEDFAEDITAAAQATDKQLVPAFKKAAASAQETDKNLTPLGSKMRAFKAILEQDASAALRVAEAFKDHPKLYQMMTGMIEKASEKQKKHADSLNETAQAAQTTEESIKSLTEYIDAQTDASLSLEGASIAMERSLNDLYVALQENAQGTLEARSATLDAEESIKRYGEAVKAQALLTKDATGATADQIWALGEVAGRLAPGSPLRVWLEEYIGKLQSIPSNISTQISVGYQIQRDAGVSGPMLNFDGSIDYNGNPLDSYAGGGIVPGPMGAPVPILAHGGEHIWDPLNPSSSSGGGFSVTQYIYTSDPMTAGMESVRRMRAEAYLAGVG